MGLLDRPALTASNQVEKTCSAFPYLMSSNDVSQVSPHAHL